MTIYFLYVVRHHKIVIEYHHNVSQKHLGNNFLTSECITDIHCLNEGKTTKDEIVKRNNKKRFFFFIFIGVLFSSLTKRYYMNFVLSHEWKKIFRAVVSAQVRLVLWYYAIISIVLEIIRYSKVIIIKQTKRSSKKQTRNI